MQSSLDLSVIIPALREGPNLEFLLPQLHEVVRGLGISFEILVVTVQADVTTRGAAASVGARVLEQQERGYGGALLTGIAAAAGEHILTMDADLSHPPHFVRDLWTQRRDGDVVIASRYVAGGKADMPRSRYLLSRVLNAFFKRGLSLPTRDLSSGFRLYDSRFLHDLQLRARDFDVLPEILVKLYSDGRRIHEVPFSYAPREHGTSNARVFKFGLAYLRTFAGLWRLRNSIESADYDDRAYDSVIPVQRYWQRTRFELVGELIRGEGPVLDVGCGSSRIIGDLPKGSVAMDVLERKVRYARKFGRDLTVASGLAIPFRDASFSCVLCSQVIERVAKDSPILDELCRVLAPGGRLVLGTPDYDRWEWRWIEYLYGICAPRAHADEHIAHYTRDELVQLLRRRGYVVERTCYVLRGELIVSFRKPVSV